MIPGLKGNACAHSVEERGSSFNARLYTPQICNISYTAADSHMVRSGEYTGVSRSPAT